jgi:hypothetical protein
MSARRATRGVRQAVAGSAALDDLVSRLRALPTVTERIASRVAVRLSELAQEAFDQKRTVYGDPYGVGTRGDEIDLFESGDLQRRAVGYRSAGRRVYASVSSLRYARYMLKHGFMPKRGAQNVPPAWSAEIRRIAEEELAAHLQGSA